MMPVCPECSEEYEFNPYQSMTLYGRGGQMLCSSRCTASYDARQLELAA